MDIQFKVYGIGYGVQGIREKIQEFGFNVTLRSVFFKMIEFLYPGSRLVLPQFPISSFQFHSVRIPFPNFQFQVSNFQLIAGQQTQVLDPNLCGKGITE